MFLPLLLLYSNTFHSPFTFDDARILDNYFITKSNITRENLKLVSAMSLTKQRMLPNLSFAIFWLLGNLVVESSFIPLELIFEHRMYLPLMLLILAGVAWLQRLTMDQEKTARIVVV